MKQILIQLVTALFGAFGFSLLFGIRRRHLALASLGGMLTWGVYLAVQSMWNILFLSALIASVFAVGYAEMLAHARKCPSTLFVVPAIIPLVPGSSLYYAMERAVDGDYAEAAVFGHQTLLCALAIAAGISFVTVWRELNTPKTPAAQTNESCPDLRESQRESDKACAAGEKAAGISETKAAREEDREQGT